MSRQGDVFQVLVPTTFVANAAPAALSSLAVGTLGMYSYPDNTPLDPATVPVGTPYYFAVGINNLKGQRDINKSAGTHINPKNTVDVNKQAYVAPVQMVTNNDLKVIQCGNEIGVKIEIRNQEAYRVNGYNQVVKNYLVPTSECVDCDTTCEDGNCADILTSLVNLINSDPDGVVTATQIAPTATDPADACTAGTPGYVAGKLILTVNAQALETFCSINLNYFSPRQTEIIVTPIDGFAPTVIATAMVYEQGSGYDVQQLEYEAGGWNGKPGPYRTYADGLTRNGFQYFASPTGQYSIVNISYDQKSISGWREDTAFERTIIAANDTIASAVLTAVKRISGL
jgi:hypothetical protein